MKRYVFYFAMILGFLPLSIDAQKKPTIMILPSDNWCEMRYFMTTYDNQGKKVKTPDYQLAFQQDTEIGPVISKVGGLLTALGYSIKDQINLSAFTIVTTNAAPNFKSTSTIDK